MRRYLVVLHLILGHFAFANDNLKNKNFWTPDAFRCRYHDLAGSIAVLDINFKKSTFSEACYLGTQKEELKVSKLLKVDSEFIFLERNGDLIQYKYFIYYNEVGLEKLAACYDLNAVDPKDKSCSRYTRNLTFEKPQAPYGIPPKNGKLYIKLYLESKYLETVIIDVKNSELFGFVEGETLNKTPVEFSDPNNYVAFWLYSWRVGADLSQLSSYEIFFQGKMLPEFDNNEITLILPERIPLNGRSPLQYGRIGEMNYLGKQKYTIKIDFKKE